MSTVRLQIVQAIAAALWTATGLTVHRNLDYAQEDRNLPALAVLSGDDSCDGAAQYLEHQSSIEIGVLVARSSDPEAQADIYEAQIHAALLAPASFAGHAAVVSRVSGSWDFDLGDCCVRRLVYRVDHVTPIASL